MKSIAKSPIIEGHFKKIPLEKCIFPFIQQFNCTEDKSKTLDLWKLLEPMYSRTLIKNNYEYIITWLDILHDEWTDSIVPQANRKTFSDIIAII